MTKFKSRPVVGLMATLLSTAPTYRSAGIHQYSIRLLEHLPRQEARFEYRAFVMDRDYAPPAGVSVQRPKRLAVTPSRRILWEQTKVAAASWRLDLMHGFAYALPVLTRTPAVVTVHDLTFIRFPQAFPASKQRYLAAMTARSCRQARAIIADSQATATDLQNLLGAPAAKIHVIYPGVDERYRPLPPEQVELRRLQYGWPQRFILMLGTLEPRKNHLGLLEAYARYRRAARQPLPLLIGGGKGWHFQQISRRVQALGLEDVVHFLGFVPWEALPWLYNAATLFVYPSRYEGFGLPVAEAMRCGTPVITSNVSSLPEVAGAAALTLNPDDADALADALVRLLQGSPQQLRMMRSRGMVQAARFSWAQTALQTTHVYNRVLEQAYD